jgi:hypothetical protein
MFNGKMSEGRSENQVQKPTQESPHYWFVDGVVNSLLPRLEEVSNAEELVHSESTMDLIEFLFSKYELKVNELRMDHLMTIAMAMPLVLDRLKRLDYPLLRPTIFECAKAFAERMGKSMEERAVAEREKVGQTLKG